MTDPERLSRGPESSLAALLLSAGVEEKPSAALLERTSKAVAVAVAAGAAVKSASLLAYGHGAKQAAGHAAHLLTASTSAAAAGVPAPGGAAMGIGAVVKWIAIGALGGGLAVSSVQALSVPRAGKSAASVSSANESSPPAPLGNTRSTVEVRTTPSPVVAPEASERERPSAPEAPRNASSESLGPLAKPEASARADSTFLAAEVHFVERGRAALQRGSFAEALDQLAPYEREFPRQQLLTEVLFLRMQAFRRLGDGDRARALAARVITLGVTGRQAAQARDVLGP